MWLRLGSFISSRRTRRAGRCIDRAGRFAGPLALVEQTVDVLATFDAQGACTTLSARGRATLGLDPEQFDLASALGEDARHLLATVVPNLVATGTWAGPVTVSGHCGVRHLDARLAADVGPGGRVRGWTLVATDVTALRSAHADLVHRATHDPLTGLGNRALLYERLTHDLGRQAAIQVVFLDLVGFKAVNDTAGHDVGDAALREVATRLAAAVGDDGLAARLGGDEFVVVIPATWHDAAARLYSAVFGEPVEVGGRRLDLDARLGVATTEPDDTARDLIARADRSMYLLAAGR